MIHCARKALGDYLCCLTQDTRALRLLNRYRLRLRKPRVL